MLRLGIVGAGGFARAHLAALKAMPDRVQVVAAARQDLSRSFPEAAELGARLETPEALLAAPDLDAVSLCVPNDRHRVYAEMALRAGKHVFCEKPMALSSADADAMVAAAEQSGRHLLVGHLTRHAPLYVRMHEILASGRLGRPLSASATRMHCGAGRSWRMDPDSGGGVVFDLLIHDIDLVNWCLGTPSRVIARGHKHAQGAYDHVAAIYTYDDDRRAFLEGGFVFQPPSALRAMTRIVCERGHIEVSTTDPEGPIRVFAQDTPEEVIQVDLRNMRVDALRGEFAEFFDLIDGAPARHLQMRDARQAIACAEAIVRAAESGTETEVL